MTTQTNRSSLVNVAFNINHTSAFTYRVPDDIKAVVTPGSRVLAPLGRRILTGIVTAIPSHSPQKRLKEILDLLDEEPLINKEMLDLILWMSEYYMSPVGQTLQIALPKGIDQRSEIYVTPNPSIDTRKSDVTEKQSLLWDIINRNPGKTIKFYREKFGFGAVLYYIRQLEKKGLVHTTVKLSQTKVKPVLKKMLLVAEHFPTQISGIRNPGEVLNFLETVKGQKYSVAEFLKISGYSRSRVNNLAKANLIHFSEEEQTRTVRFTYKEAQKSIVLNREQRQALESIKVPVNSELFKVFLIHGVTGSGKTQVYLESIKHTLERKRTAIVLIPEISLTPQTVQRIENFFPGKVAVFHSKMSLGERFDTWRKIQAGDYPIVVGPRSALFMPMRNLGIIVVDEEHDASFKQSGSQPRYHARDVAIFRAKQNNCVVLLGSATPSMESYHNAKNGKYTLLHLARRIKNVSLPGVQVIDMRYGHGVKKVSQIFSTPLLDKIKQKLEKNEQIILLQNRRGYSSFVQCTTCGFIPQCPHCAIALTYHSFDRALHCHYCGYHNPVPGSCSSCAGEQLKYQGSGTQKIEQELKKHLPHARVLRMDQDTTTQKNAHDRLLNAFRQKKFDILLGTQMIAKGLDIPDVTLVGVIAAEIGLSIPDFRAAEKIFQLLTQVAGRAGRDDRPGEVVIQCYLENHYAIRHAQMHNFEGFFNEELSHRKNSGYPPLTRLINIKVISENLNKTIETTRHVAEQLRKKTGGFYSVVGPAPCPITLIKNNYRWQILLKLNMQTDPSGKNTKHILKKHLQNNLKFADPDTRVNIDVDPVDMI